MRKKHLSFLLILFLAFAFCLTSVAAPVLAATTTQATEAQTANLSITAKPAQMTLVGTNKTKITYTITNTGNVRLTSVVLKDEDIAGSKAIGSVDALAAGASKTFTYEASFTRTSVSKPVVTAKAGNQNKTFTGTSQQIVMGSSKLSGTLKAGSATVTPGQKVQFTLTLKNDGTSAISNITVSNAAGTALKEKISVRAGNSTDVTFEDTVQESGEYYVKISGKDSSGETVDAESNKVNLTAETTAQTVNVKEGLKITLSSDATTLEKAGKVKITINLENATKQAYKEIKLIDKATNKELQTIDTLGAGDSKLLNSEIEVKETTKFQYQVKAKAEDGTEVSVDSNTVEVALNKQGMSMLTIFLIILGVIVVLIIITGTTLFILSRKEKKKKKEAAAQISQKYRPQPGNIPEEQQDTIGYEKAPFSTFTIDPTEQPQQQTMPLNIPKQSSDFSTSDYEAHPAAQQAPPQRPAPQAPPRPAAPPPQQQQPKPVDSHVDYNDLDPDL